MMRTRFDRRGGFTMVELLIAIVVTAVLGGALIGFLLAQSRFLSYQDALKEARGSSRSGLNMLQSDLRMVEVGGGVEAAAAQDITLRVPYAFGVVCKANVAALTVSLLPVDSAMYADAAFSGYAWMDSVGAYTYVDVSVSVSAGNANDCTSESITTLPGGRVVRLAPGTNSAGVMAPVFAFQRIRYELKNSVALPGRMGLFRTQVSTSTAEEIVTPFNPSAGFRFYVLGSATAQSAPPSPVTDIRGIELVLNGASQQTPAGRSGPTDFDLTTAVFFKNRAD